MKLRLIISFVCLFALCFDINAQDTTTTKFSGSWTSGANWHNGVPASDDIARITKAMNINTGISITGEYDVLDGGSMIDPAGGTARTLTVSGDGEFDISGDVTFEGAVTFQNNCTVWVRGCDTLTTGSLTLKNNSIFIVEACAVLIVNGNLTLENNNDTDVDGYVQVNGNVTGKNNATMAGSGNLNATGSVTLSNSSAVFGSTTGCADGVTDCSYGPGPVLPIELSYLSATLDEDRILVEWETMTETKNDYFILERLFLDELIVIDEPQGAGNSNQPIVYQAYDTPIQDGVYRYKLTQVDFDGAFQEYFSNPVTFSSERLKALVYPNPTNGELYVRQTPDYPILRLELITMSGEIRTLNYSRDNFSVDISDVQPGVYFLRIFYQYGKEEVHRIVVSR